MHAVLISHQQNKRKVKTMRKLNAAILAPVMKLTGFRFSKDYRHGSTLFHKAVYACVDTVGANMKAGW
tara:strand:- start:633 stop:836 length:204 start_codon:yes stop_codon:yes gene_type:complete